jgi:hypothetical protein
MRVSNGDQVVLSPENLRLLRTDQLRALIHQREMQHEEIVIIVFVDFGTLYKTGTVVYVQGVEMEVVAQEVQVFHGWICYMVPFKSTEIDGVNHFTTSFLLLD